MSELKNCLNHAVIGLFTWFGKTRSKLFYYCFSSKDLNRDRASWSSSRVLVCLYLSSNFTVLHLIKLFWRKFRKSRFHLQFKISLKIFTSDNFFQHSFLLDNLVFYGNWLVLDQFFETWIIGGNFPFQISSSNFFHNIGNWPKKA